MPCLTCALRQAASISRSPKIDLRLQLRHQSFAVIPLSRWCVYDMTRDDDLPNGDIDHAHTAAPEDESLLRTSLDSGPEEQPTSPTEALNTSNGRRPVPKRQSSLSQPRPIGTPRTTNRVRFELNETSDGQLHEEDWVDDEDYLNPPSPRAPLLTDITPPSLSPFLSDAFQPEEHLPNARPKSGMRNAIMNMANSIIGAGEAGAFPAHAQNS